MNSSEFRAEARRNLSGRWGKAIVILLAYGLIAWAISFVGRLLPDSLASLVSIAEAVINVPLAFGLTKSYVKLYNGEDVAAFDFLTLGFNSFSRAWGITFSVLGKVLVPLILMIVSYFMLIFGSVGLLVLNTASRTSSATTGGLSAVGIIGLLLLLVSSIWYIVKSYYYKLAYIVASEDENMTSKDVVNKSRELMDGKRGKLFILELSFIGWAFLCVFTLGIGYLWLVPYMQFAVIAFYKFALGSGNKVDIFAEEKEEKAEE